jgi:hypothetical protein
MSQEEPVSDSAATEYKKRVQDAIERMEIEYDKALLALNPAAITVSIALYNQLIAAAKVPPDTWLLHIAWFLWLAATVCTLLSFLFSKMALEQALAKFEQGQLDASNYKSGLNRVTTIMNWAAGGGFLFGLFSAAIFFH